MGEQIEEEIQQLTQNLDQLTKAANRYHTSGRALETFKDETEGKEMLVPLTSSLYVSGTLGSTERFCWTSARDTSWRKPRRTAWTTARGR